MTEKIDPLDSSERIQKVLARAGIASRREAERLILEGRVKVNGVVLKEMGTKVSSQDTITVDDKPVREPERLRLWLYYKPKGLVCSHHDPEGRPTIFEKIRNQYPHLPRLISVGRLDMNSEGLLLLTNVGELAHYLESPKTAWRRRYRVRIFGKADSVKLETLKQGITVAGIKYAPIDVTIDRQQGQNAWVTLILTEGKNREIRKIMEYFEYPVNRLIRTGFGPFQIGSLNPGDVDEVHLTALKASLGKQFFKG